jgi:Cytochrome P450
VITSLLGIPDASAEEFAGYGATIGAALDGTKSLRQARRVLAADGSLERFFHDVFELLRADPSLAARAVEEVLRYDPPVQRTSRIALEPAELGGTQARKDQMVITLLGAAGRDPEVYPEPARLTSPGTRRPTTSRSPAASTTARARRWPGSRPRSRSRRRPSGYPGSSWPGNSAQPSAG